MLTSYVITYLNKKYQFFKQVVIARLSELNIQIILAKRAEFLLSWERVVYIMELVKNPSCFLVQ